MEIACGDQGIHSRDLQRRGCVLLDLSLSWDARDAELERLPDDIVRRWA